MDEPKVLVVADELEIREMLEFYLGRRSFTVRTAVDGVAALAQLRDWRPDAIILDVVVPKVDGITLLPMIRRASEAPVIMLTSRSEFGDVVKGFESGADDYVSKPFEVSDLVVRLRSALRRPPL